MTDDQILQLHQDTEDINEALIIQNLHAGQYHYRLLKIGSESSIAKYVRLWTFDYKGAQHVTYEPRLIAMTIRRAMRYNLHECDEIDSCPDEINDDGITSKRDAATRIELLVGRMNREQEQIRMTHGPDAELGDSVTWSNLYLRIEALRERFPE